MAEESNLPVPDPTPFTTEAINRAAASERDYVDGQLAILAERLRGIDRATLVLNETVNRVPTDVQNEVGHLRELLSALRELVEMRLRLMEDWRKEQKADTEKAVQSALSAAKEAVKEQTTASQLSINKSETGTAEQLKQLTITFNTAIAGQASKLDDVKDRIGRMESAKQGGQELGRGMYAAVGLAISLGVALIVLLNFLTK